MHVELYAEPGPLTGLTPEQQMWMDSFGREPAVLCHVAQGLLISPMDAVAAGLAEQRMGDIDVRPASALLQRALELDPSASLDRPRPAEKRVVGTCRHYAVIATALLRAVGVPARARCGFATYFVPGKKVDHWIIEHWSPQERRWVRIDPEYLDRETPGTCRPDDLRPGEFLAAGEAWVRVRDGEDDPMSYGVFGTSNWGISEIRGNAMRDLASLAAKTEMLPWDEWGQMADSYAGTTGEDFDRLIDDLATATADPDHRDLQHIYGQLAVPSGMVA